MRKCFDKSVVVLVLAVIMLFSLFAQAVNLPDADKLVPPETLLLISIDNFSQMRSQFEKTYIYQLYKEPSMQPFVESAKSKWREGVNKRDENDLLRAFVDAGVWPQGRVAVAFMADKGSSDTNEPPMLFITQWGPDVSKVKDALAKLMQKNIELGGRRSQAENFEGVTIESLIDEQSTRFSYSFIDDCLIAGAQSELVKFVIAHIKGASSATLSSDGDYLSAVRALGPNQDLTFYLNIEQLIKQAISSDTTNQARTTIANLGLDNVTGIGMSLGLARTSSGSFWGKMLVRVDGSKKGICRLLETRNAPIRATAFIPSTAYAVSFINLDIKQIHNELANILTAFSPGFASFLYTPLTPPTDDGKQGLQLKQDIIDYLGSQIIVAEILNKPFSVGAMPVEYLIALEVANRAALEKSLATLHSQTIAPNKPDAKRELLGHTIYLIDFSGFPLFSPGSRQPLQQIGPSASAPLPIAAFTVTDTHLIFGVESSVEKAIRTLKGGESVAGTKWFDQAKAAAPATAGFIGLENTRAAAEFVWWTFKQTKGTAPTFNPMIPSPSMIFSAAQFDFHLLPEFDVVSKYFGLSVSYLVSRPDGFYMEFRDISPTTD